MLAHWNIVRTQYPDSQPTSLRYYSWRLFV